MYYFIIYVYIPPIKGSPTSKAMPGTQLLLKSMQLLPYSSSNPQRSNKRGQLTKAEKPTWTVQDRKSGNSLLPGRALADQSNLQVLRLKKPRVKGLGR